MSAAPSSRAPSSQARDLLDRALALMAASPSISGSISCDGDCGGGTFVIAGAGQCGERSQLIDGIASDFAYGVSDLGVSTYIGGHVVPWAVPGIGRQLIRLVPRGSKGNDSSLGLIERGSELDVAATGPPYPVYWSGSGGHSYLTETFTDFGSAPASVPPDFTLCGPTRVPNARLAGTLHVTLSGAVSLPPQTVAVSCNLYTGRVAWESVDPGTPGPVTQMVGISLNEDYVQSAYPPVIGPSVIPPGPHAVTDVRISANIRPAVAGVYEGPVQLTTESADPWSARFTAEMPKYQDPARPTQSPVPLIHVSGDFSCSHSL